ncbi:radical SAM protein, partial [Xylella fastidiosa subsp. multiplex]|nr:radical SAM protein [Xylella fastidiosa subsp. multiplex]
MTTRPIITADTAASCYFRTSVEPPYRKALIQICEPCNEKCAHCFVSAT